MRTANSYTSAVRGFLNQDLYIFKPISFKQVTKASTFAIGLTFSSLALFSSSELYAAPSTATNEVASAKTQAAPQESQSETTAVSNPTQAKDPVAAQAKDKLAAKDKDNVAADAVAQDKENLVADADGQADENVAADEVVQGKDNAAADIEEQKFVKVSVDQSKNDQKPQVVDHEFDETAAADDAIMADNATSALEDDAKSKDLQIATQDKATAVDKFNAFAADRPKRSGSLADGGLNTTSGIVQWLLSTIAVLGIIFLLAFLIKKSRFVQRAGSTIRLETQMALGPKERIVQVRVGDRHLLLGVTPSNISLILELDNDSQKESKAAKAAASKATRESYDEEDDDCEYIDDEFYAKSLKSSESKVGSKEISKAKIKAQAARKVAARATSNLTMMPDDDVLHERASRLKHAMRHIGMDEQGNAEIPSVEKTSVVFSQKANESDATTTSALEDNKPCDKAETAESELKDTSEHSNSCMSDANANSHVDQEKLSDAISSAIGDASAQNDTSEADPQQVTTNQAESIQDDALQADSQQVEAGQDDALQADSQQAQAEQGDAEQAEAGQDDASDSSDEQLAADDASESSDEQLAADDAHEDVGSDEAVKESGAKAVATDDKIQSIVKAKLAVKDETVLEADGSSGVTWLDHEHKDEADDEHNTHEHEHAHSSEHSSMADADSRTSKADPKGEEFARIFVKAYAQSKERVDELTETEAGRDIMAADLEVSDNTSDKTDSKEKKDL